MTLSGLPLVRESLGPIVRSQERGVLPTSEIKLPPLPQGTREAAFRSEQ